MAENDIKIRENMSSLRIHRGCNQVTKNECFEKLKIIHVMKFENS